MWNNVAPHPKFLSRDRLDQDAGVISILPVDIGNPIAV
jgi:hypothetical protein